MHILITAKIDVWGQDWYLQCVSNRETPFLCTLTDMMYDGPLSSLCFSKITVGMVERIVIIIFFWLSISCLSMFLHYLGFAWYLPLYIFLLRNNLFLYQVRCTTIFHRRNLDSFLYQCSAHGKIAAWVRILCPPYILVSGSEEKRLKFTHLILLSWFLTMEHAFTKKSRDYAYGIW